MAYNPNQKRAKGGQFAAGSKQAGTRVSTGVSLPDSYTPARPQTSEPKRPDLAKMGAQVKAAVARSSNTPNPHADPIVVLEQRRVKVGATLDKTEAGVAGDRAARREVETEFGSVAWHK